VRSTNRGTLFVDSHCHLDRYENPAAVLAAARRSGVVVVAVTETPADFRRQIGLFDDSYLRPALGLHPLRAARLSGREVEQFFSSLGTTDYVGEIGVDLSRHGKETGRRQMALFERILEDARIKNKVLTVHSRGAARETADRLEQAGVAAILHWYTGSLSVAERALAAGNYFSVNPSMLSSKSGRRLLQVLGRDRVLTETDGPYTKSEGRTSQPSDIPDVTRRLAGLWSVPPDEAAQIVVDNMARLHRATVGPPLSAPTVR